MNVFHVRFTPLDCGWGGASVSLRFPSMTSTFRTRGMLIERFGAECIRALWGGPASFPW
jgi:hypothetical protein